MELANKIIANNDQNNEEITQELILTMIDKFYENISKCENKIKIYNEAIKILKKEKQKKCEHRYVIKRAYDPCGSTKYNICELCGNIQS